MHFSESDIFFDLGSRARLAASPSFLWKDFFKQLAMLPFVLVAKAGRTALRVVGLALSAALVFGSLGCWSSARFFFVDRMATLSRDLADWVLLPFSVLSCLCRLIFTLRLV